MRTWYSLQLTYIVGIMQRLIFSFSIDLIFSQIVWCFHIDIFFTMDPSQRKLVVLLIFQFASFIALFYTSIVNVEASFKSKFFISYTSIHD